MKVYTVYLDGDRGWTGNNVSGFYTEAQIALENQDSAASIPTEEEFNKNIENLSISENYKITIGDTELEIRCEDMLEEEFNNLDEFAGW